MDKNGIHSTLPEERFKLIQSSEQHEGTAEKTGWSGKELLLAEERTDSNVSPVIRNNHVSDTVWHVETGERLENINYRYGYISNADGVKLPNHVQRPFKAQYLKQLNRPEGQNLQKLS